MRSNKLSIIVLMYFEHPAGLLYIESILKNGFDLKCIIAQRNPKMNTVIQNRYSEKMGECFKFKTMSDILDGKFIPTYFVKDQSSKKCVNLIKKISPDLIILGGAGIVKYNILRLPKIGTINSHPGLIPIYRGCTNVEWALYNNGPVGATCHFVTEEIDWGDIIIQKEMDIKSKTYYQIRQQIDFLCAEVLIESIKILSKGDFRLILKIPSKTNSKYWDPIPDDKLEEVKNRIY